MKKRPSEELKRRLGNKIKLNRLRTAFKRRENSTHITAPRDVDGGRDGRGRHGTDDLMGENEFERELGIPWKR
jgi:hypothetical protein